MGKQILILGAVFGGLTVARNLRSGPRRDHKITTVDRQLLFFMGLTKLWVLNGTRQVGDALGNRTLLARKAIDFIEGGAPGCVEMRSQRTRQTGRLFGNQ